jgi:hypothetical protein
MIPINERHLRRIITEIVLYYPQAKVPADVHRYKLPTGNRVRSTAVLGGLHREYCLEKEAA